MSVAGRLVTRRQPKVCQGLSRSIKFCCSLPRSPNSTLQLEPENRVKESQIDGSEEEIVTRVEIIITEWTWVVSLYYRGVIGYNFPWQTIAFISLKISQCRH